MRQNNKKEMPIQFQGEIIEEEKEQEGETFMKEENGKEKKIKRKYQ